MQDKPLPLEQVDSFLSEIFMDIASGKKSMGIDQLRTTEYGEMYCITTDNKIVLIPAPVRKVVQVGRNEKCYCGSEKKFKKCCGKK